MFTSLRSRLWLSYTVLILTALGIIAFVLLLYLYRNPLLYRQKLERLSAIASVVVEREQNLAGPIQPEMLQRAARTFDVRLVLYSADQLVLADTSSSDAPPLPFPGQTILKKVAPFAQDGKGKNWLFSMRQLSNGDWLLAAVPRPRLTLLNIFTDDLLPLFVRSGLFALLLSLIAAYIVARWIADPLQKIVNAARAIPAQSVVLGETNGPHEVRELARAFDSMIARLQGSQKSQRDFVANVSHELKTPLTSIQGFAQAIMDDTAQTPEARKQAAGIIYSEAGRMHRIVIDLLDLARLEAGTAEMNRLPVDIQQLLTSVCEKFKLQANHAHVSLQVEAPDVLPKILADGDRLAQVITNLVDNALKYTPGGGSIELWAEIEGEFLQVTVSDNGSGIRLEDQAHIFDRFFQADRARVGGNSHGAGLGLAIAREIMLAHGGTISVQSQPGRGTSFALLLPLGNSGKTTQVSRRT